MSTCARLPAERHLILPGAAATSKQPATPRRRMLKDLVVEAAVLVTLLVLYRFGRLLADGRHEVARQHADAVWTLERRLHLPAESGLQQVLLDHDVVAHLANSYYASVHYPLTALVLVWLFLRHRPSYSRVRNVLVAMTAAGLAIAFAYPLAPPRMMNELGMVDLAVLHGQSVYQGAVGATSNQYAAMPSLHVGWAVLVAWAMSTTSPTRPRRPRWSRPLRWLWWFHPLITVLVVVGTGNHFWLDAIVGTALFTTAMLLTHSRRAGRTTPRPAPRAIPRSVPPLKSRPRPRSRREASSMDFSAPDVGAFIPIPRPAPAQSAQVVQNQEPT